MLDSEPCSIMPALASSVSFSLLLKPLVYEALDKSFQIAFVTCGLPNLVPVFSCD